VLAQFFLEFVWHIAPALFLLKKVLALIFLDVSVRV